MFAIKKNGLYKTNACNWTTITNNNDIQWYPCWLPAAQDAHKVGAEVVPACTIIDQLLDKIQRLEEGDCKSITEHAYESEESQS